MEKKLSRAKLAEVVDTMGDFYDACMGDEDVYTAIHHKAADMATELMGGDEVLTFPLLNLISACRYLGSTDKVAEVLALLGWGFDDEPT